MALNLFRHNREGYESAIKMLQKQRKTAVIHPTGTGKSFIAFQLCLDHPESRIGWLSPSEYIFQTQLGSLKKASAGKGLGPFCHQYPLPGQSAGYGPGIV